MTSLNNIDKNLLKRFYDCLNYFEEDKIEIVGENEYIDLRDEDERIEERYWK